HGCGGPNNVTSGQKSQREDRHGIPPDVTRCDQRLLSTLDVILAQPDSPELCQGPSDLSSQEGAELVPRGERFFLGFIVQPTEPQDLGTVDPTTSVDAPDRVGRAPSFHRLGP